MHVATFAEASQRLELRERRIGPDFHPKLGQNCFSQQSEDVRFGTVSSCVLAKHTSYIRQDSLLPSQRSWSCIPSQILSVP